jgi:hypothetical protein
LVSTEEVRKKRSSSTTELRKQLANKAKRRTARNPRIFHIDEFEIHWKGLREDNKARISAASQN